ncbi:MAG: hypothetical protein ABI305_14105, partial [Tepidiformaceae bacterium]
ASDIVRREYAIGALRAEDDRNIERGIIAGDSEIEGDGVVTGTAGHAGEVAELDGTGGGDLRSHIREEAVAPVHR